MITIASDLITHVIIAEDRDDFIVSLDDGDVVYKETWCDIEGSRAFADVTFFRDGGQIIRVISEENMRTGKKSIGVTAWFIDDMDIGKTTGHYLAYTDEEWAAREIVCPDMIEWALDIVENGKVKKFYDRVAA